MNHNELNNTIPNIQPPQDTTGTKVSEVVAATALTSLAQRMDRLGVCDLENGRMRIPMRYTKNGRKRAIPFPLKLMQVLSNKELSHIITWMPSGKSFVIIRRKAFAKEILPGHFKSAQYASFTRKLHRWGFTRADDGAGEFYHTDFQEGRVDLAERMTCHSDEPPKSQQVVRKIRKSTSEFVGAGSMGAAPSSQPPLRQPSSLHLVMKGHSFMSGYLRPPKVIDLEAMRLQECIEAAAMSRAALAAMMQRRVDPSFVAKRQRLIELEYQKRQLDLDAWRFALSGFPDRSRSRSRRRGHTGSLLGLDDLPRTNIQGAKTA